MLVHSLPLKSTKKLPCDIIDTCATHAGLVYNVTDPDCQIQNGSNHSCVCMTFKMSFLTYWTTIQLKNWYQPFFFFFKSSVPVDRANNKVFLLEVPLRQGCVVVFSSPFFNITTALFPCMLVHLGSNHFGNPGTFVTCVYAGSYYSPVYRKDHTSTSLDREQQQRWMVKQKIQI